jgi:glutamyl-tRNA synthetase
MDYQLLAELLYPQIKTTPAEWEAKFPPRKLPAGARVTRIGPSPTGFIHLGNLYNALIGERLAHQSYGVFFLRIEDTDAKREVAGAVETIIRSLGFFGVEFDEGATIGGERGSYGPYRQRQRKMIYQSIAKHLVAQGHAYPCFCSEEALEAMRQQQMAGKLNFGYYGKWAKCHDLSMAKIKALLAAGKPFVLRFRSPGNGKNDVRIADAIRGELTMQENYQDFVLLKSDSIPTYHFAHVVDDHLMRTTHVVRGEEWLATLPMHVQLFDTLGWQRPLYCHTAVLEKLDGGQRRKLSKRKDPELALSYYQAKGYLPEAVWEYLLTVLNSNYEEWRLANPGRDCRDFPFTPEKMSNSGTLFDLDKLNDISKEVIAGKTAPEVYDDLLAWAEIYDPDFAALLIRDRSYAERIIDVGRQAERPRKDLMTWAQAVRFLSFYYDETFRQEDEYPVNMTPELRREIIDAYLKTLVFSDENNAWFAKVRLIAGELGFALKPKDYQKNPAAYRGSIVDLTNVIRVSLTGRQNSPDLWEVSQILGESRVKARLKKAMG